MIVCLSDFYDIPSMTIFNFLFRIGLGNYDNTPNAKRIAQNFNRLCNTLADTDTMTEWTDDLMRIWLFEFIVVYIFTDKIMNI